MQPNQIASARAHALLAELISLGVHIDQPITATAKSEGDALQVVITLARYDGPMRLYLTPEGSARLGLPENPDGLTPIQQRIINVLDSEHRRKGTWIASKVCTGGRGGGGFRSALAALKRMGLVGHEKGRGYYRMSANS
jgi:hypothetical protein